MSIVKNVTVTRNFHDGTLSASFKKLGYPAMWKTGERRDLPDELLRRVVSSGGQITLADPGAKESHIVEETPPAEINAEEYYAKLYGKGKKVRVLFPEGFTDGNLSADLAAIGHPAEIGVGEILDLPSALLVKIKTSGATVDLDPQAIGEHEQHQPKHLVRVKQWLERRELNKTIHEQNKAITAENMTASEELEVLSKEYLSAQGSEREAIWQRMRELKQGLKRYAKQRV